MPDFDLDSALNRPPRQERYDVDLKWSAWSADTSCWEERAPDAWAVLQGLLPNEEVEIRSAPTKEIRYANILVSRSGAGLWHADGGMSEQWDQADSILGTLNLPDSAYDELLEMLPYDDGEVGVQAEIHLTALSLEALMDDLDDAEDNLISRSGELWTAVASWAEAWLRSASKRRRAGR